MKDGGPAFPVLHSIDGNWVKEPLAEFRGMSLRDYFAAAALQGLLASPNVQEKKGAIRPLHIEVTTTAFEIADAMLTEREKS